MPSSFVNQTSRTPLWDALFRSHPLSNAGEDAPSPWWDFAAVVLWVAATTLNPPLASPLRLALAGFFTASLLFYWRQMLPRLAGNFPFMVLPILIVISAGWSISAASTFRYAGMMAMTTIVCVFIAARLNRRQIIHAYFFVELIAGLLSLMKDGNSYVPAYGIFPHKNVLAIHMFFLFCTAFSLVLAKYERLALRLLAVVGVLVALRMIFLAQSATTTAFTLVAVAGYLFMHLVWIPARRMPHMRTLLAFGIAVLGLMAMFLLFGILQLDAKESLLNALGKDSTLTGRTMLWDAARGIIEEHPWTGLGPGGFWQPWIGQANSIVLAFHYDSFVTFNFHNSYLELGVSLGYPGMVAGYLVAGWATLGVVLRFFRRQDLIGFTFLIMGVLVVIRSNTEIDLAVEFAPTLVLMMISAMVRIPNAAHLPQGQVAAPEHLPARPHDVHHARPHTAPQP